MSNLFIRTAEKHPLTRAISVVGAVLLASYALIACGGPSTKAEVCKDFDAMGQQLLQGNGLFGNPAFHAVKNAGSTASRYPDDTGIQSDGEALMELGDADSMSIDDVLNKSIHIATLCGHPAIFGGG